MTKTEYLNSLVAIYLVANQSDTELAMRWQGIDDSSVHCRAIEGIFQDMGIDSIAVYMEENDLG